MKEAKALQDLMIRLAEKEWLESAHDCSEGGLAVALAESCILNEGHEIGADVSVETKGVSREALLFGESQSRVVISVSPRNLKKAQEVIQSSAHPHQVIGKVGGRELSVSSVRIPVQVLSHTWRSAIGRRMHG